MDTRARMTAFLALVAAVATAPAGCGGGGAGPAARVVEVKRQDLVVDVEVTGTLKAVDSSEITPPAIPNVWEFKIVMMIPEGTEVKAGQEVLAFDVAELQKRLVDQESEIASLVEELGKSQAEGSLATLDDKLALEEAEAKKRKAEVKADKPEDLAAERVRAVSAIDRDLARREVEYQTQNARARRAQEHADLAVLQTRLDKARSRAAATREAIAQMHVKARRAGTVVYSEGWRGEKKKIGDNSWRGETILLIASLDRMAATGHVDEVDASRVHAGQRVTLRLEAHPDGEYAGVVEKVAELVQTESPDSKVKVVQLDVKLDKTDPVLMRPGMRFRGRIEVSRTPAIVQIPLAAIRTTAAGPVVLRVSGSSSAPVPVTLGRRSRETIEVTAGLREGDRVALPTGGATKDNAFRLGAS